ncbi:hypothetical protein RJ639_000070 [Escallonia herrerae]|nr:hypothetical protein RJ639_000070 [Escallonia herrerae]
MEHIKKAIAEMAEKEAKHQEEVRLHEETKKNLDLMIQKAKQAADEMRLARIEMEHIVASMEGNKKPEISSADKKIEPQGVKLSWAERSEKESGLMTDAPIGIIPLREQSKLMSTVPVGPTQPKEEISLRPKKPLEIKPNKWYAIFNGPRRGIYSTWAEASKHILGSSVRHRSYKTIEEAELALKMDQSERFKPYNPFQLESYKDKLEERKRGKQVLLEPVIHKPSKIIARQFLGPRVETRDIPEPMTRQEAQKWIVDIQTMAVDPEFEEDLTMFAIAEELPGQTGWNTLGFDSGADPKKIRQAFDLGLCKLIILSKTPKEIELLPLTIVEGVKKFQDNTGIEEITLTLDSIMPIWDKEGRPSGKPLVMVWIQRTNVNYIYHRWNWKDQECPNFTEELLDNFRARQALSMINQIRRKNEKPIFVNGSQPNLLLTSRTKKKTSSRDTDILQRFVTKIISNNLGYPIPAAEQICSIMRQSKDTEGIHLCKRCPVQDDSAEPSREEKAPTDKSSEEQYVSNDEEISDASHDELKTET